MLWSYWRISADGLRSPKRPKAFTCRYEADANLGPRHRARKDVRLVCLLLRVDGDQVVPEFHIEAVGRAFALKCRRSGPRVDIYGEIPEALWYEDAR